MLSLSLDRLGLFEPSQNLNIFRPSCIVVDPVSMAFLRSYAEAAMSFDNGGVGNPLTRVDCYDWTDVCGKQNITKFPTVYIYKNDKDPVEYKGLLDGERVISYLRM
jgi:hypothetical protein